MKLSSSLLAAFFFGGASVITLGAFSPAVALSKTEVAANCVQAIEDGDLQAGKDAAAEIVKWKNLFSPALIKNAETCL